MGDWVGSPHLSRTAHCEFFEVGANGVDHRGEHDFPNAGALGRLHHVSAKQNLVLRKDRSNMETASTLSQCRIQACGVREILHGDLRRPSVLRHTNLLLLPDQASDNGAAAEECWNDESARLPAAPTARTLHSQGSLGIATLLSARFSCDYSFARTRPRPPAAYSLTYRPRLRSGRSPTE